MATEDSSQSIDLRETSEQDGLPTAPPVAAAISSPGRPGAISAEARPGVGPPPLPRRPPPLPSRRAKSPSDKDAAVVPPPPPVAASPSARRQPTASPAAQPVADVAAQPVADVAAQPVADVAAQSVAEEDPSPDEPQRGIHRGVVQGSGAFLGSLIVHLLVLVALAFCVLPEVLRQTEATLLLELPSAAEEELLSVTLAAELEASSSSPMSGGDPLAALGQGAGGAAGAIGELSLDQRVVDAAAATTDVSIGSLASDLPDSSRLIEETPDGALGDPRAIVDDYDQAMDRITQEVLWMLSKSDVLLLWCFDQSESMKDDQQEIRSRIERVYSDLGLRGGSDSDSLTSAVTSYGERFLVHTRRPTSDLDEIRQAIDSVPIDPSGVEMMCAAVQASILGHLDYVKKGRRQMALILITDETGDRASNVGALEPTIALARQARCRVYTLGREAVFGYPYAHMKWRHPFTGHVHWLPIDRGPETGFVQQLQTDGFRRRYDAHPSGFGPFEQTRLARETGGIFFMLPSLETNLVRGEKRRYELEAMRAYRPDLRAREQILADRDGSELRRVLWKIINDLDPYNKQVAEVMEVRYRFSPRPEEFVRQVREEQAKVKLYLGYLDAAARTLELLRYHREQETSPRWQANYDLMEAQVIAYTARTYEYAAYLENFINHPKPVPLEKPNMVRLSHWDIRPTTATVAGPLTDPYIDRAGRLFRQIVERHPGTPWAARAEQELARGFGFELDEQYSYYGPRTTPPRPTTPNIPIPKL